VPRKVQWAGEVLAVQPRIRLTRSFDERSHTYLGFVLQMRGTVDQQARDFSVGIGPAAQAKHGFEAGHRVSGLAEVVENPEMEPCAFYKVSGLTVSPGHATPAVPPPWRGRPPTLDVYRARGHRRLDPRTYSAQCQSCIWGCRMPVDLILDQWNPQQRRFRSETFCYGPKSCRVYRAGPPCKVPGRRGMSWTEEDWIDDEATAHRGPDE
jgi:hypothetical protein